MRPARPQSLIDILEPRERKLLNVTAWRTVSDGKDPLIGYRSGGRWDDGTFDVLYTSLDRDGSIAETVYHQRRGQPIIPSKPRKRLHSINVALTEVLDLGSIDALRDLGADVGQFGRLSYSERVVEYPSLQEIAEVAHFLAFQAMLVPNARWQCQNLVIFTERCGPQNFDPAEDCGILNLEAWHRQNGSRLT